MLRKLIAKLTGNCLLQGTLGYISFVCQYFQGIGSGTSVGDSGEEIVFRRLLRNNPDSLCVFDVGANKGQFLELTQLSIGSREIVIHCFEPSKVAFSELSRVANNDIRVTLNNRALGRVKGEAHLFYDEDASGLASLSKRNLDHIGVEFGQSEIVNVDTLDSYCQSTGITHIDLLKIDVEGHELDVLIGAESMFVRGSIDMVQFEFGGANIDTRTFFRDFYLYFKRFNMDVYRITPSGFFVPIVSYSEQHEQFRTTNFLCMRRDLA